MRINGIPRSRIPSWLVRLSPKDTPRSKRRLIGGASRKVSHSTMSYPKLYPMRRISPGKVRSPSIVRRVRLVRRVRVRCGILRRVRRLCGIMRCKTTSCAHRCALAAERAVRRTGRTRTRTRTRRRRDGPGSADGKNGKHSREIYIAHLAGIVERYACTSSFERRASSNLKV